MNTNILGKIENAYNLLKTGYFSESRKLCLEIISTNDDIDGTVHYLCGLTFLEENNFENAEHYINEAILIEPKTECIYDLAFVKYQLGKYSEAIKHYLKIYEHFQNDIEFHVNLINFYEKNNQPDKALIYCIHLINLGRDDAEMLFKAGVLSQAINHYDQAEYFFHLTLAKMPENPVVLYNIGNIQLYRGEFIKAVEWLEKAHKIRPKDPNILNNLAKACYDGGELDKAEKYFFKYLVLAPHDANAKLSLAEVYFLKNDYANGLELFENRFLTNLPSKPVKKNFLKPEFNINENNLNKTVYVYYEQSIRDTLNFVRYLPLLAGRVKNIIFKPQDLLYDLIKANYPAIKVLSSNNDDSTLIFDCHISILSLLKQLKVNVRNIPSAEGYLKSFKYNPDSRLENLFNFDGLKIGLCWNSSHLNDKRNIALEKLKPVLDFSNNRYYSLQQGNGAEQLNNPDFHEIINIAPNLFDFAATAVFIKKMDLIITVDSAVAHLAAAMNKPVFILLPAVPDWRWGINSETTPWYHSAVLIKQEKPYNWDSAITKLKEKLMSFQKEI